MFLYFHVPIVMEWFLVYVDFIAEVLTTTWIVVLKMFQ
jgi:hypothetical protein